MNLQDAWEKALRKTEIVRARVLPLETFTQTRLPYIALAEAEVNRGDTVVRKGEVLVEKPSLILPHNLPQFEGFDFEKEMHVDEKSLMSFLLVRGVTFPSLKFNNQIHSLDIHEGRLSDAMRKYAAELERSENVHTGLIAGPSDCWPFSVLLFVCSQAARSAGDDFKKLYDHHFRQGLLS